MQTLPVLRRGGLHCTESECSAGHGRRRPCPNPDVNDQHYKTVQGVLKAGIQISTCGRFKNASDEYDVVIVEPCHLFGHGLVVGPLGQHACYKVWHPLMASAALELCLSCRTPPRTAARSAALLVGFTLPGASRANTNMRSVSVCGRRTSRSPDASESCRAAQLAGYRRSDVDSNM